MALVAALLTAPSLTGGLATEDWLHKGLAASTKVSLLRVNLFGHEHPLSASELSRRFVEFRIAGFWPWTTDPTLDISFFRPIASLTHLVDYRLWPDHPALMHAESIAWYAALALAVAGLYRRLDGPTWPSGLAAMLYAADDAHGHAVGWLINRNAIMAGLFGVLALISWDRFRRHGARPAAAASTVLLLALCLGSAEAGLSIAGYFVAYTLFIDQAPGRNRWLNATIWMATFALWALVYRRTGHAVRGSGLYVDPVTAPAEWASQLLERGFVLFMGQYGAPFSDAWSRSRPFVQGFVTLFAVSFTWLVVRLVLPLLRRDRAARFWALGSVLAIPPACSTFCEDRLLFFVGIGAMPVIVAFVKRAWEGRRSPEGRLPDLALAAFWVAVHGIAAPALLPVRSLYMKRYDARLAAARDTAFAGTSRSSTLVLVNGEDFYFTGMLAQTRVARGEPVPSRLLTLAGTPDEVTLRRLDAHALEVTPEGGFLTRVFNRIYRSAAHPLHRGDHVDLTGIDVTVADTSARREPMVAVFRFPTSLDSPEYQFRIWDERSARYEPFTPPPVGRSVTVKARP